MKECIFKPHGIAYRINELQAERPTLVFVHGLAASCSVWVEFEQYFSGTANLLSFDLLGHGKSRKPRAYREYSIQAQAAAISDLISDLGLRQTILVSHSLGTLVALELILSPAQQILSSVFISPAFEIDRADAAQTLKLLGIMAGTLIKLTFGNKIKDQHLDYTKYKDTPDWDFARMSLEIRSTSIKSYLSTAFQIYGYAQQEKWKRIEIPVLILHGQRDSKVPVENAVRMQAVIPNSQLVILEQAGHNVPMSDAAEALKVMESFLGRCAWSRSGR